MATDKTKSRPKINIENCNLEEVTYCDYLGTNINNAGGVTAQLRLREEQQWRCHN